MNRKSFILFKLKKAVIFLLLTLLFSQSAYAVVRVNIFYNESNNSSRLFKTQLLKSFSSYEINYTVSDLDQVTNIPTDEHSNNSIYITLGRKALQTAWKQLGNKKIFSLLVNKEGVEKIIASSPHANRLHGLYLEQSLKHQLSLAQQLIPKIRSIGFLTTPDNLSELQEQLKKSRIGVSFEIQPVSEQKYLGRALSDIIKKSELLITLAEPKIYNRSSLRIILLSSYRNNVPLIGLNKAFVDAGCLAAVYTKTDQFVKETAGIIKQAIDDGDLPLINYAKHYDVSLNHKVASSLGIYLQSEKKVLSRMRLQLAEEQK